MFNVKFLLLGALTILNAFFYRSDAATCTAFTSSTTCQQTTICAWDSATNKCYCKANANSEVVFLMDSSYSVTSSGWTGEKNFVKSVVNTALSAGSYVGIVVFSSSASTKHTFNSDQRRNKISDKVGNLGWEQGTTATYSGLKAAVDVYKTTTKNLPRILFLITDGNPFVWSPPDSQNPCADYATDVQNDLKTLGITVVLIKVGPDINSGVLSCLYDNDPSRVISATDFTQASMDAIRAQVDAYLCPTSSLLRIGEVRVDVSTAGNPGGNARFLEVYNHGTVLDFAGNNLKLTGFVSGTISQGQINKGQRLVVYDKTGTAATDMQCTSCTCAAEETNSAGTLSNGRCSNAVYIGCGDSGASCTFSSTMTNSYWKQTVGDTLDRAVWVDVTHDSITNNLATVPPGFTFEVVDVLLDATTGANWKRSCLRTGTPGSKPLDPCPDTCTPAKCQETGDGGATCVNDVCDCTSPTYYSNQYQCSKLPPPSNCNTYISKQGGAQYATIAWTVAGTSLTHNYKISYTFQGLARTGSTVSGSGTTYFMYGGSTSGINPLTDPVPTVKTAAVVNNEQVESISITCPFITSAPTASPTNPPTAKPTRKPTNQPSLRPTLRPTGRPTTPPTLRPTQKPTQKPTSHPTVAGYTITSCHITVKPGSYEEVTVEYTLNRLTTDVSDADEGLTLELSVDTLPSSGSATGLVSLSAAAGSPQDTEFTDSANYNLYYLWPRYRSYPITGPYTGHTRGVECTLSTSVPTPAPSKAPTPPTTPKPSTAPTRHPTKPPTQRPTLKPTYETVAAHDCVITLGSIDTDGTLSASHEFIEPTYNFPTTPDSGNVVYIISWGSGGEGQKIEAASKGSEAKNTGNSKKLTISHDDDAVITAYTKDPNVAAGPAVECDIITLSPTPAPTRAPHPPTPAPVLPNIDLVVDTGRCAGGTQDGAGRVVSICEYEVSQGAYTVNVELNTGSIDNDLTFAWEIVFDHAIVEPKYVSDYPIAPKSDFGGVLNGTGKIQMKESTGGISLLISDKADKDAEAEVAWLTLTACNFASGSCAVAQSTSDTKTYQLRIVNAGGAKQQSSSTLGDMPTWIWYPIAAGVLILAGLAAFGYMYYNKRKLAEEQLQRREADLANAEELDNLENFGGLGDNINFNPIATAGTQDVATGGEYIDKQLAKQQKNAEFAQVDVDKEVWRQDFGQIKADRHDV